MPSSSSDAAARAASDKLGQQIIAFDVSEQLAITDAFVLASATNDRQVKAIVDEVEDKLREIGAKPIRREGERDGRWVLIDYGDIVVHVQHEEERAVLRARAAVARLPDDRPARRRRLRRLTSRPRRWCCSATARPPGTPSGRARATPTSSSTTPGARRPPRSAPYSPRCGRGALVLRPGPGPRDRRPTSPTATGLDLRLTTGCVSTTSASAPAHHGEYAARTPRSTRAYRSGRYDVVPGGETTDQVVAADRCLRARCDGALGPGESGVLVGHGAALKVRCSRSLGWPDERPRRWRHSQLRLGRAARLGRRRRAAAPAYNRRARAADPRFRFA